MSSVKLDSNVGADEVRKMTTQWGYNLTPAPTTASPVAPAHSPEQDVREERRQAMQETFKSLINGVFFVAGATTGLLLLAFLAMTFKLIQ